MNGWEHTSPAQQVVFGVGALARMRELLGMLGARRVLLVTTSGRLASEHWSALERALGRSLESIFDEVEPHAPAPAVQAAAMQARRDGSDAVVSFGGGSCTDVAKAVCFFAEQEAGTPGVSWLDRPVLPHVAVPTTWSGAAFTPTFAVMDLGTRQQRSGGGPTTAPVAVVCDPNLTTSLATVEAVGSALGALAHCAETLWSSSRTPEAEALALRGAALLWDALPSLGDDPDDADAHARLGSGAVLAGRSLQSGTAALHHGLVQLIGARSGIAHGLANALLLPHTLRYVAATAPHAVTALRDAIGAQDEPADLIAALLDRAGLATTLGDVGVTGDDVDAVVRLSQSHPDVQAGPMPVSEDEVSELLHAAC